MKLKRESMSTVAHDRLDDRLELEYLLGKESGMKQVASLARDRGTAAWSTRQDDKAMWWRTVEDAARQMAAAAQKERGKLTAEYNKTYPDDAQPTASLEFPPTQEELSNEVPEVRQAHDGD